LEDEMSRKSFSLLIVCLSLVWVSLGCGVSSPEESGDSSSINAEAPNASAGNNSASQEPDTSAPDQPLLEGEACLVGAWQLDNSSYLLLLQSLAAQHPEDLSYDAVYGSLEVVFTEDGIVSNNLQGFGFTTCAGSSCKDYDVPPSAATTYEYDPASGHIDFAGGQIVALNFENFEGSDLYGVPGIYSCSDDQLSVQYLEYPPVLFFRAP
jgi:hypothetical protein